MVIQSAAGETCDGSNMGGNTCQNLGYDEGSVSCYANCTLNTTQCRNIPSPVCGNGVIESGETCDDANTRSGDGCSVSCAVESGWTCTTANPSTCTLVGGVDCSKCDGSTDVFTSLYSPWTNGPRKDKSFFPIGVWLQDPSRAGDYKAIGINTFIGLWQGPTEAQLSTLKQYAMPVIAHQNDVGLTSANKSSLVGWSYKDEPDNAQKQSDGSYGPCIAPSELKTTYNALKSKDATRPVYLNFGRGVADINWNGRGTCKGDTDYYRQAKDAADIISFDIYPVNNGQPLDMVAKGIDNLYNWSNNEKIIWNILETTSINGGSRPTPSQIKAEVWMSLVHGSKGITYFAHEFQPSTDSDALLNYPETVSALTSINARIAQLAPVLNSSTIKNAVGVSSAVPVDVMIKRYGGKTYLFAVVMSNNPTTATFTLYGFPQTATATVLDENRTITINNGVFSDSFVAYGVHLYEINYSPAAGVDCSKCLCGNSVIDAGETFDGTNLGGKTCQSLGYNQGSLSCNASCVLNTTQCNNIAPVDTIAPKVSTFTVTANPVKIAWSVTDSGGTHLDRIEIWRAPDNVGKPGTWGELTSLRTTLTGQNLDAHSASISDSPSTGTWWYGLHAVDKAGNIGIEPDPPGPLKFVQSPPPQTELPIVTGQCPFATWPASNCTGNSITIKMNDPRPTGFGSYRDLGTSPSAEISFKLDKNYTYGCYANSFDVWVLDPGAGVTINSMSPTAKDARHGWAVDYSSDSRPFDTRRGGSGTSPSLPYVAKAVTAHRPISITKMESYSDSEVGTDCRSAPFASSNGPCTKFGYTLTVVPEVPQNNGHTAFRPPWTGIVKPTYSTNNIMWALLPQVSSAGFSPKSFKNLFPWCVTTAHTVSSIYGANWAHPHFNIPEYGADIHNKTHFCTFHSFLKDAFTQQERELIAVTAIQMGIDLFYTLQSSPDFHFQANAGWGAGRQVPVVFAAAMLNDTDMKNALLDRFKTPIGPNHKAGDEFSEDGQVVVSQNGAVLWGSMIGGYTCKASTYWNNQNGEPGARDCADPDGWIDGGETTGSTYQSCCSTATYKSAVGGFYLMPEMADLVMGRNNVGKKLFDYVERAIRFGAWTLPDPKKRFPDRHGAAINLAHKESLGMWLYDAFSSQLRTTKTNAAGQPALDQIRR